MPFFILPSIPAPFRVGISYCFDSAPLRVGISCLFDSAPLGAESGIVSGTRSSGLASPRQRRRSFVSSDFTKSAMPLSSGSLAPFVNVAGFNTQLRCGALRHQNHQGTTQ